MSIMTDLVVYDGAATPVSHTLKAISVRTEKGVTEALWREANASLPTEAQISVALKTRELPSRVTQVEMRTNVPVMEATNGANAAGYTAPPKVAYVDSFVSMGYFHPRSTETGRRLARQLHVNALNGVGTSVVPNTTGFPAMAYDAQIMPT